MKICDAAGISLPKGTSEFPYNFGFGHSPAKLGSELRASTPPGGSLNKNGGVSPSSKGPCD